eukprot:TRINITY_DN3025_c0_g2_i4.p1 TRINITY_DN3025_c0_g2~~TRINITY_DN3025_c0_g2_i4.p1  ORF type:complete len:1387 (+),score=298.23 TRINITY_DN3025_c0_g2_i4:119-4162(+)
MKIQLSLLFFISLFVIAHAGHAYMVLVAGNTGTAASTSQDGPFTAAKINPTNNNNIIKVTHEQWAGVFAEESNHIIRAVDFFGNVQTIAGQQGVSGFSDIGSGLFNKPRNVVPVQLSVDYGATDGITSEFAICDYGNNALRYIDMKNTSEVSTIATFDNHVVSVFQIFNENPDGGNWYVLHEDEDGTQYISGFYQMPADPSTDAFSTYNIGKKGAVAISVAVDGTGAPTYILVLTATKVYQTDLDLQSNTIVPYSTETFTLATGLFMDYNSDLYIVDQGVGKVLLIDSSDNQYTVTGVSQTYNSGADSVSITQNPTTNSLYLPISFSGTTNSDYQAWYLVMTAKSIRAYWGDSNSVSLAPYVEYDTDATASTVTFRVVPDTFFTRYYTEIVFHYQINGAGSLDATVNLTSSEVTVPGYTSGALITYYVSFSFYDPDEGLTTRSGPNNVASGYALPLSGSYRKNYNDHYSTDGSGTDVHFSQNTQIAVDHINGDIYAIQGTFLKKISPDGSVTTLAGQPSDQSNNNVDGYGTNAILYKPSDLCVDPVHGYVYIANDDTSSPTKAAIRRYNMNTGYLDTLISGSTIGWIKSIAINENTYDMLYYASGTIMQIGIANLTKTVLKSDHVRQSNAALKYTNRFIAGQEHLIFQYTSGQNIWSYSITTGTSAQVFGSSMNPPFILDDYSTTQTVYYGDQGFQGTNMGIWPGSVSGGNNLSPFQVFSSCLDIFPFHVLDPNDFYPYRRTCNGVVALAMIKAGTFVAVSDVLTVYFNSAPTSPPFIWVENDDGSNYQLAWTPTKFEGITSWTLKYTVDGGSPTTLNLGSVSTHTLAYNSGSHYNISVTGSNLFGTTPSSNTVPMPNTVTTTTTTTSTTTTSTTTTTPTTSTTTTPTTTTSTTSTPTTSTTSTSTATTTSTSSTSTTGGVFIDANLTLSIEPNQYGYYLSSQEGEVNVTVSYTTQYSSSSLVITNGADQTFVFYVNPEAGTSIHVPLAKANHTAIWKVCLLVHLTGVEKDFCSATFGINAAPKVFQRVFRLTPQYQLSRTKAFSLPINETEGDSVSITSIVPQSGSIDCHSGINFNYTAPKFFNGTDRVDYTVCDDFGGCVTQWFNINILNIVPECDLDPSWKIPKSQVNTTWTLSKLSCNTTLHDKYHYFGEVISNADNKAGYIVTGGPGDNSSIVMTLNPNRSGVVSWNFTLFTTGGEYYYFSLSAIIVNKLPTPAPYTVSWNHLTATEVPDMNILSSSPADPDGDSLVLNSLLPGKGATPSTVKQLDPFTLVYTTLNVVLQGSSDGTLTLLTAVRSGANYVAGAPINVKTFKGSIAVQFSVGDGDLDQTGNLYAWSTATITAS